MNNIDHETKYQRAKEKVKAIRCFYTDLIKFGVFLIIILILYYFYPQWYRYWLLWIAFAWSISIIIKAFKAFDWLPFLNKNWEDQKVKEFMEKDNEPTQNKWS